MKGLLTSNLRRHFRAVAAFALALTILVSLLGIWGRLTRVDARELAPSGAERDLPSTFQQQAYDHFIYLPFISYSPVVYYDDFSNPNSGWPNDYHYEDCYYKYADGRYRVQVSSNGQRCIIPNLNIPKQINGTFSVRARRTSSEDRHLLYGLIFGAGSNAIDNRWGLEIYPNRDSGCDNKPFMWLYALVSGDTKYFQTRCTDSIDRDKDDWNELKVVRNGGTIDIYINGDHKGPYTGANYLLNEGYTLLEVVSASDDDITVEFDDFTVSRSTQLP
jgi:hypothetical protein